MSKRFYVNVAGGTGLNISLASFISYIKMNGDDEGNKDYEFYVSSPYFDVFEACEYVDGVYKPQELKDMVMDAIASNGELILTRLYDLDKFVKKELNYSQAWAELMHIPFTDEANGTKVKSLLNPLNKYPHIKKQISDIKELIAGRGYKNYAIMQFTGGQSPLVTVPQIKDEKTGEMKSDWSKVSYNYENEPLKRHYPQDKAQEFLKLYHEKYPDRAIIAYQLPNEPFSNADYIIRATIPYLAYYELAKDAIEIVCIDSSLQHLTAGLTKTTVIWGHSLPKNFGYCYNNNVVQNCRRDDLFYFTALGPSGARIDYIKPKDLIEQL